MRYIPECLWRSIMRHLFLCLPLLLLTGCSGCSPAFETRFEKTAVGDSTDEVKALLGAPAYDRQTSVQDKRMRGPGEGLSRLRAIGTPLREWQYTVDDHHYFVWFEEVATDEHRVLAVGRFRTDDDF
jgi:hypothetical protein